MIDLEVCPICGCGYDYLVYAGPFSDDAIGCDECAEEEDDD